jgi:hypothetical protein
MTLPRLIVRGTAATFVLMNCLILLPGCYVLGGSLVQAARGRLTLGILFAAAVGAWMVVYVICLIAANKIVLTDSELSISVHTPSLWVVPRFFRRCLSLADISAIFIGQRHHSNQQAADFPDSVPSEPFNYLRGKFVPLVALPMPDDSATGNPMIMFVRTNTADSFAVSILPFSKSRLRTLLDQLSLRGLSVQTLPSIDSD